jgi:hypothetical protein
MGRPGLALTIIHAGALPAHCAQLQRQGLVPTELARLRSDGGNLMLVSKAPGAPSTQAECANAAAGVGRLQDPRS